jgi:excisionase family DNA binding protein
MVTTANAVEAEKTNDLLDITRVSQILRCSERHVYRLCDSGRMPPKLRVGRLVRWRRSDIEQWLVEGCPRWSPRNQRKGA